MPLSYMTSSVEPDCPPLTCSHCERERDLVCALQVGPTRESVEGPDSDWIGLCEDCLRQMLDGFVNARLKAGLLKQGGS